MFEFKQCFPGKKGNHGGGTYDEVFGVLELLHLPPLSLWESLSMYFPIIGSCCEDVSREAGLCTLALDHCGLEQTLRFRPMLSLDLINTVSVW